MLIGIVILLGASLTSADYLTDTWKSALWQDTSLKSLRGEWIEVIVGKAKMQAYMAKPEAKPEGSKPAPAVIVVHHAVGIYHRDFMRQYADDLAKEGFVAVVPDFFHRIWDEDTPTGLGMDFEKMKIPKMLNSMEDSKTIEDLDSVLKSLENMPEVDPKGIGILGFCLGGRISWLAAVESSFKGRINAAVPYHGGNVFKGKGEGAVAPGHRIKDQLHCPVFGHFGAQDMNPSLMDMFEMQNAAGRLLETKVYEGEVDHGFACKDSAKYVEAAASEAWTLTLDFLVRKLVKKDHEEEL